ncbi:MAG: hypothetical protein ACYS0F_08550 [Planctomycetota bacterium]|jgi:hypothetical protein
MHIARIWKKPPSLFFPGWIAAVVGGTVLLYVLIYVLILPWGHTQYVDAWELPDNPRGATGSAGDEVRIDLLPDGAVLTDGWSAESPCQLRIHRATRWVAIRRLLLQLRADGLRELHVVVRNDDGSTATLRFDLASDWPELDADATAQEFVDTLR